MTCSDLNGLNEVLDDVTNEGWVNWDKHGKVATLIWSVKRFMRARYILNEEPTLQRYLDAAPRYEGDKAIAAIARLRNASASAPIAITLEASDRDGHVRLKPVAIC